MKHRFGYRFVFAAITFLVFLFALITETNGNQVTTGDEEYLIVVEKTPSPAGGMESIMKKVIYPDAALKAKLEGKVYLLVLISENGDVDDSKVVKGIGMGCDEEAVKVIKKTKFNPAQNKGANVKAKLALVLNFKLS